MAQKTVDIVDISKRFGPALGSPVLVNTSGTTTIYTPAAGKSIRLKWMTIVTPASNTAEVIVQVVLSGKLIYWLPFTNPFAFSHSSVREGMSDGTLDVILSVNQSVYFNIDVQEFDRHTNYLQL